MSSSRLFVCQRDFNPTRKRERERGSTEEEEEEEEEEDEGVSRRGLLNRSSLEKREQRKWWSRHCLELCVQKKERLLRGWVTLRDTDDFTTTLCVEEEEEYCCRRL